MISFLFAKLFPTAPFCLFRFSICPLELTCSEIITNGFHCWCVICNSTLWEFTNMRCFPVYISNAPLAAVPFLTWGLNCFLDALISGCAETNCCLSTRGRKIASGIQVWSAEKRTSHLDRVWRQKCRGCICIKCCVTAQKEIYVYICIFLNNIVTLICCSTLCLLPGSSTPFSVLSICSLSTVSLIPVLHHEHCTCL